MHTGCAKKKNQNVLTEFSQKGRISSPLLLDIWFLVVSFIIIIQNEPNTLHALYLLYINTSSYQLFTELTRKVTNEGPPSVYLL